MDVKTLWSLLGASVLVNTAVTFVLNGIVGRRLDAKNNAALETVKQSLSHDLEIAKHQLQLEQSRLNFVFEQQRESFTKVVRAMHDASMSIDRNYDYNMEEWRPVRESVSNEFEGVRVAESLYTGAEGDLALAAFSTALRGCVTTPLDPSDISSDEIRAAKEKLDYIAPKIQEYFRRKIGTSLEQSPTDDQPLTDVFRLDALRILNLWIYRKDHPTPITLIVDEQAPPSQMVAQCRLHRADLLAELVAFVARVDQSRQKPLYYDQREVAQRYVTALSRELKAQATAQR